MIKLLPRAYLAVAGLAMGGFGIWFLLNPIGGAASLGLTIAGDNASFEMRGIYGGVHLGLAVVALIGAIRPGFEQRGLWPLIAYFGGYTFARGFSLIIGEIPTGAFIFYAIFEAVMFVLAIATLMVLRRGASPK